MLSDATPGFQNTWSFLEQRLKDAIYLQESTIEVRICLDDRSKSI